MKKIIEDFETLESRIAKRGTMKAEELFTDEFMEENTDFKTYDEFLEKAGLEKYSEDENMDRAIRKFTDFEGLEDMVVAAFEDDLLNNIF